jgi:hypothetical protein
MVREMDKQPIADGDLLEEDGSLEMLERIRSEVETGKYGPDAGRTMCALLNELELIKGEALYQERRAERALIAWRKEMARRIELEATLAGVSGGLAAPS